MNLTEFVTKLFLRYPPDIKGDDTIESYTIDFTQAISTGKTYNYDNAFIELMRSYSFKTTPPAKIILEILSRNEIKEDKPRKKIEFPSIWGYHPGHKCWYEFGVELDVGEHKTTKWLISKGFISLTNQNPYIQRIGA